jgi:hypothetical protein
MLQKVEDALQIILEGGDAPYPWALFMAGF